MFFYCYRFFALCLDPQASLLNCKATASRRTLKKAALREKLDSAKMEVTWDLRCELAE
jgi:hypothetical protein